MKAVKAFLSTQPSYTRFRPRRKRFKRRQMLTFALHDQWQGDLLDYSTVKRHNSHHSFILVLVEGLSSYVWLRAMKNKSGVETERVLRDVFESSKQTPKSLLVDKGKEFYNRNVISLLERRHVLLYSTENQEVKASKAERMCRVVRSRIARFMDAHNTFRYVDALPHIADSINSSVHRVTRLAPKDVNTSNQDLVFQRRYGKRTRPYDFSFAAGDVVRVAEPLSVFAKSSRPTFSDSLYRVDEARGTQPHTYRLSLLDSNGHSLGQVRKAYYSQQMVQQLEPDPTSHSLRRLPKRTRNPLLS